MTDDAPATSETSPRQSLLLLGATGATGQEVLSQALREGHHVTALVRDPSKIEPRHGLTVREGDARDASALAHAMTGLSTIVSALGRGLKTGPTTLIHDATAAIIDATNRTGLSRVVFLSSFGVGASRRVASPLARLLYRGPARKVYADKAAGEELLKASSLDWTLLYPVSLTDTPATGHYDARDLADLRRLRGFLPRISRADVATAILDATTRPDWIGKTIVLS